jgi:hypothetical protein
MHLGMSFEPAVLFGLVSVEIVKDDVTQVLDERLEETFRDGIRTFAMLRTKPRRRLNHRLFYALLSSTLAGQNMFRNKIPETQRLDCLCNRVKTTDHEQKLYFAC